MAYFWFFRGAVARLSFSVALVVLAGCDAVSPAPPLADAHDATDALPVASGSTVRGSTVRIPVHGATRGDIFYTVGQLLPDVPFTARLESADGLAFTFGARAEPGTSVSRVSLTTEGAQPDSVVVEYVREGISVAEPTVYRAGHVDVVEAGVAAEPPTSWHWEEIDGKMKLIGDYYRGAVGPDHPEGVAFTTASGEKTGVTHVRFTLYGVAGVVPEAVVFSGPSTFTLDSVDF